MSIDVSIVIPVFNGATSIGQVVDRVVHVFGDCECEIILIDDGSLDDSANVCSQLAKDHQGKVIFIQLSRNFGEHNAVMAGLAHCSGSIACILDDDGQNPPEELPRMIEELKTRCLDVVYGLYMERKHPWHRRLGSWFNDRVANVMLGKPRGLYLSSFKVMNRRVVREIVKYRGPFPYIDGLICRATMRLGHLPVQHAERLAGSSNYTLNRLVRLWFNMFMGFSILPLRMTSLFGLVLASLSFLWLTAIAVDKLWITPDVTLGIPTVLACVVLFSGVELFVLGMIGEYLGRIFLANNGHPQYVIRSISGEEQAE